MIGNFVRDMVIYEEDRTTVVSSSFDGGLSVLGPPNPLTVPDFDFDKAPTHTLHVGDITSALIEPDFWLKNGTELYRILDKTFVSENIRHRVHVWNVRHEELL